MKVIGLIDSKKYLMEVNKDEIEQFMNLYYNKMENLNVGDEVNLGKGHDWYYDTKKALDATKNFFESNIKIINVITKAFINDAENEDTSK